MYLTLAAKLVSIKQSLAVFWLVAPLFQNG